MNKKSLVMIASMAAAFVVIAITVLGITNGCGDKSDTVVNLGNPEDVVLGDGERTDGSSSQTSQSTEDHSGEVIPDSNSVLPDKMINVFSCVDIYQQSVPSEISAEQALDIEQINDIIFGPEFFSSSRYLLELCSFDVDQAATWDELRALGIDVSELISRFGGDAQICCVRIFSGEGEYKTTVFLIGEDTLIAFGEGMHVFEYEAAEAVG